MAKGLKVLSNEEWYGGGYCGVCGSQHIVPKAVRWWDCDDGWKMGVLCEYCTEEVRDRGPQEGDYAFDPSDMKATAIDLEAELGDTDGVYSHFGD